MNNDNREAIKALELLNLEYINLKNSKSFLLGNRILETVTSMKQLRLKEILVPIRRRRITKKLNREYGYTAPPENKSYNEWLDDLVCDIPNAKIVIYTCLIGNYDMLNDPLFIMDGIEYIVFSDHTIKSDVWKTRDVSFLSGSYDNTQINRYIKLHPKEIFPEFDFSIYIDANVTIVSNLLPLIKYANNSIGLAMHKHVLRSCIYEEAEACLAYGKGNEDGLTRQVQKYRNENFPSKYGMVEATVIVANLNSELGMRILDEWWKEFISSNSNRDQIALPYILWKMNISVSTVCTLGSNVYMNPKFIIKSH